MARHRKIAKTPKVAAPDLFNFVTPDLAVGGRMWNDHDVAEVVAAGITHIIDLRGEQNSAALWRRLAPQVTFLWLGIEDDGDFMPDWWWTEIVHFAETALNDPTAKVLVHCSSGMLRGPSAAYAILRAVYGFNRTEAVNALAARPIANPIFGADFDDFHAGIPEWDRMTDDTDDDEDERPSNKPLTPWMRSMFGHATDEHTARMLAIAEMEA